MLETIRDKMKGAFATVVVVFISAIFALWGVESLFNRQAPQPAVATVDGKEITEAEVLNGINNLRQRYMQMFNGQIDPSMLSDQMLRGQAIEQLITSRTLAREAEAMQLSVGQLTIDRQIVQDPTFSQDGKTFDPEYFKTVLRSAGLTAVAYNQQLAANMRLEHLQQGLVNTAFVTERQIQEFANLQAQQRAYAAFTLTLDAESAAVEVADSEIEAYYQANEDKFMTDETVALEYLEINKDVLAKSIDISDDELQAKYDAEKEAAVQATERQAAHILVDDEVKANELKAQLDAGADFAALAKANSSDTGSAEQGGDVGYSAGDVFVKEFEDALAALTEVGQVSAPVKTEFGYHIIKLLDKRDAKVPSFDERKAALKNDLQQVKAADAYSELMERLVDLTYSAGDLAGPAQELGLAVERVPAFGRRGGAGIAAQQKVIEAAFGDDLISGTNNSPIIELSPSRAVVIRVAEHKPSKLKELAEVKAQIASLLQREAAEKSLQARAEALAKQLKAGASLDEVGAQEKLTAERKQITRAETEVPATLVSAVFAMPRATDGISVDVVDIGNGDRAVVVLENVIDANVSKTDATYLAAKQSLLQQAANAEFSRYDQAARAAAKVKLTERKSAEPAL